MVAKCWFDDFLVSNPENMFINFYTHSGAFGGNHPTVHCAMYQIKASEEVLKALLGVQSRTFLFVNF